MLKLGITLVSRDVVRLSKFYKRALDIEPSEDTSGYVRFEVAGGHLSIWSAESYYRVWAEKPLGSSLIAEPDDHEVGAHLIEFHTSDGEAAHARLEEMEAPFVKGVTTQSWGNTSFWVRDPDGNLINFYWTG